MKFVLVLFFTFIPNAFSQILPDEGIKILDNGNKLSEKNTDFFDRKIEEQIESESRYKRKVIDILAIPHKNETYFMAEYEYSSSIKRDDYGDTKRNIQLLDIGIERGITEVLSLQAQISYLLSDTSYDGRTDDIGVSRGISDPLFGLNYRLLDVSKDRFDLNINPYGSASFQEATYPSGNKDGNGARGYNLVGVKVGIGRRDIKSSWGVIFDFFRTFEGKLRAADNGDAVKVSSFKGASLSYDYMTELTPKINLKSQIGLGLLGGVDYSYPDGSSGSSETEGIVFASLKGYFELITQIYIYSEFGLSGSKFSNSTSSSFESEDERGASGTRYSISLGVMGQF